MRDWNLRILQFLDLGITRLRFGFGIGFVLLFRFQYLKQVVEQCVRLTQRNLTWNLNGN